MDELFIACAVMLIRPTASRRGNLRLSVSLSQKVAEGGTVRMYREARTNRHADMYDWRIHGRAALAFLQDVRPYLVVKARHADVGIAYGATLGLVYRGPRPMDPGVCDHRIALFDELRALNRKGRVA